ncbi:hypothetical protein Bbelb_278920 [Branchiostoma belcheri]|nr:hypothetical protein Bbelb_278920 [Branchiostoma belcheri]
MAAHGAPVLSCRAGETFNELISPSADEVPSLVASKTKVTRRLNLRDLLVILHGIVPVQQAAVGRAGTGYVMCTVRDPKPGRSYAWWVVASRHREKLYPTDGNFSAERAHYTLPRALLIASEAAEKGEICQIDRYVPEDLNSEGFLRHLLLRKHSDRDLDIFVTLAHTLHFYICPVANTTKLARRPHPGDSTETKPLPTPGELLWVFLNNITPPCPAYTAIVTDKGHGVVASEAWKRLTEQRLARSGATKWLQITDPGSGHGLLKSKLRQIMDLEG